MNKDFKYVKLNPVEDVDFTYKDAPVSDLEPGVAGLRKYKAFWKETIDD